MKGTACKSQIVKSDQGSQFIGSDWGEGLKCHEVKSSKDGKGSWVDDVFIERLWRKV